MCRRTLLFDESSEMDTTTKLVDLIEQLDRKRNILEVLDKQITAGISDDNLEAEILGSEEIHECYHPCKLLCDMQACINVLSAGLIHASQSCQLRGSGIANYGSISDFVCICLCVMLELPCSLGEYTLMC